MSLKLSFKERVSITLRGFRILKKYCPGLVQSKALSAIIASLQPFVSIWFSAQIINEIFAERRISILFRYVLAAVLIQFFTALFRNVTDKVCDQKEAQMWDFFYKIFSDKQMAMDFADLENAKLQHQKKQAEENLFMFGNGLGQLVWGTAGLVKASVNVIVSLAMTVTLFTQHSGNHVIDSPLWCAVLLLCTLFGGLCSSKATIKENRIFEKWMEGTVWFNRTFMFYGRELYMESGRAKDLRIYEQNYIADCALRKLLEKDKEDNCSIFLMSIAPSIARVIIGMGNSACYLFVVLKAFFGAFGVGSIVQYVGALERLSEGLQEMMFVAADNNIYCLHLQKLFHFLDIPNKMYQGTLPIEKRAFCDICDNDYEIEFRNVSFRYPSSETYVLKHISIKFKVGRHLAVVGMNGSGKTTFIKLLCRLYDPTEGEILLNGINIKKYDYDEYMHIFSVVFQDFKLFSLSLGQNVAAAADYDRAKVKACLIKAGFGERLSEMPDGVDTCLYKDVAEDGVEISGGEAQKIALARALYKDAPFIILDEPTAALDPIAEYEIYHKFNEIADNKTTVYISHRLSSCRFCDEILVFDNGQIIQQGSHDTLIANENGKYYALWNAQAQYYSKQ